MSTVCVGYSISGKVKIKKRVGKKKFPGSLSLHDDKKKEGKRRSEKMQERRRIENL